MGSTYLPFTEAYVLLDPNGFFSPLFLIINYVVPNGGYTASCMLAAASAHLSSRGQPDTLTAHFEYPSRTAVGPAIVVIDDVKLSHNLSTLHLSLWQDGLLPHAPWLTPSTSRRVVLAYTNHMNLRTFTGITMPTGYSVTPAAALPSPLPDFERLKTNGSDDGWEVSDLPKSYSRLMRSLRNWSFYMPRGDQQTPGAVDMWIRMTSGESITQSALAYVVDSFPHNQHLYLAAPELRALLKPPQQDRRPKSESNETETKGEDQSQDQRAGLWFPTVVMNLEVKKALPDEGVEWLVVRVTCKEMRDGKFDLDVLVRDVEGEIVALSHHVAMIVSIERNTASRKRPTKAAL